MGIPLYLDSSKMTEAEVSLRAAQFLATASRVAGPIEVAIDGAQVQIGRRQVFPVQQFMADCGWSQDATHSWRGTYKKDSLSDIIVGSEPGRGDVRADLTGGTIIRLESKKGPLFRSKASQEYPLLREALGQLLTVKEPAENEILGAAVPKGERFEELAVRWRLAPLIVRTGIRIVLVGRDGSVSGLEGVCD